MENHQIQKVLLRRLLTENGWKRDGRCKKHETYKRTVDRVVFKVEFRSFYFIHAESYRERHTDRLRWRPMNRMYYEELESIENIPYIKRETQETVEMRETQEYLERIGAL